MFNYFVYLYAISISKDINELLSTEFRIFECHIITGPQYICMKYHILILGKCQSGGELRLTELCDKLPDTAVPEGFCLVGAKSPMLIGLTLVAAVDRRYLPSENNSVAMLGFSGKLCFHVHKHLHPGIKVKWTLK